MKITTTLVITLCLSTIAFAQTHPPCPGGSFPNDNCANTCISCDFQNGISLNTGNYTADYPNEDCLAMHNNFWFGFIAGQTSATFTGTPSNCSNQGIQMALYGECDGPCLFLDYGCDGPTDVVTFTADLIVGETYFLVVDGCSGDICDVEMTVDPIEAIIAPPINNSGPVLGLSSACPNGTVTYCLDEVYGASQYVWNIPSDATLNGLPGPGPITLSGPGSNCAEVKFGPSQGSKQICIRPSNGCFQGQQKCKVVNVQKLPENVFPSVNVCQSEADNFQLPWGNPITPYAGTQTYQATFPSYLGCDSIVKQTVTVVPSKVVTLAPKTICKGECLTVAGEDYCESGSFSTTIDSYQGCDSVINFSLTVVDINPLITYSGSISCANPTVTLHSVPQPGTLKTWKNALGQTLSTGDSLVVSQAGDYYLSVTANAGGTSCSLSDTATVTGSSAIPSATATATGYLGCTTTTVQLDVQTNGANPTFAWSGPNSFSASIANPVATAGGNYSVTVTSANGCTASASTSVQSNTTPPTAQALSDTITCSAPTAAIQVGTNATGATFLWNGPNSFTASVADTMAAVAGVYSVTVTNPANGCTAVATTSVVANLVPPDLSTSASGMIGCPTPVVTMSANTQAGIVFSWNGPGGFTSLMQFPGVSVSGSYSVTVSGVNGCTSAASVTVAGDTNPPHVEASGGTLSCAVQSVVIDGNSNTPGAGFFWTGPGSFSSNLPDPVAGTAGNYILTVTGPNGCTATDTAIVQADVTVPDVTAIGGIISCSDTLTVISGSSNTPGVVFQWIGPGSFSSIQPVDSVGILGNYLLTATAPNGCTSTAIATVTPDADIPNISLTGDTLTCSMLTVLLDGGSTTPGILFTWSGPNNFTASTEDVTVSVAGTYVLTATDPSNGCKSTASTLLTLNDAAPGAGATGGTLACSTPSLTLQGNSPTSGVGWSWTGPGNFVSTIQNPVINLDGQYTLVVTNPANGCTSAATALVQADLNAPQASAVAGTLTCTQTSLVLSGNSTLPGTFGWAGPNGFVSNAQNPTVDAPGTYTLTVVAQNGCVDTAVVLVDQNITAPDVTALGDTIDCISGQAVLAASSATFGVTWAWTGPNNFNSTQPNPTTTVAGNYTATGTAPNGCSATATTTVSLNNDAPQVNIGGAQVLTCALTSVVLTVTGMTPGVTGQWDNGQATLNLSVTAPGTYTFTATGLNGCVAAPSVSVLQDIQAPQNITASGGETDCDTQIITINGSSTTTNVSWLWSGPGNYSSTIQNPNDVSLPGAYTLQVTNLSNGCTAATSAEVTQNIVAPVISVTADSLTCSVQQVTLEANSDVSVVSFQWSGPNNFNSVQEDPVATLPGLYTVVATAGNGCTSDFSISVHQNILPPGAAAAGDTITCITSAVNMSGGTSATDVTYSWSGPGNFSSNQQNPTVSVAGIYQLIVTGTNGCTSTASATVSLDGDVPQIAVTGGTVTCATPSISLSVTSNLAATWQWTGPNNFTSTLSNPAVGIAGNYTVTGSSQNGCTATATATVLADNQPPVFSIAAPDELDCTTSQVSLIASVQSAGSLGYQWSTPTGQIVSGIDAPTAVVNLGGPYTLIVTNNQNGCTAAQTAVVPVNPNVPANVSLKTKDVTCFGFNDGGIEVISVTGGTLPMLYALDGGTFSGATNYQGLLPGQHIVRLQDAAGCELEVTVTIQEPGPLSVNLGADTTLHLGNPILLPVLSATSDPLRVTNIITQPLHLTADTVIFPVRSFIYFLSVSDSNNCSASGQMRVLVDKKRLVYIPNVFNPEAPDNAIFKIYGGIDVRIVRSFRIYDRWGSMVHEAGPFLPDDYSAGWTGMANGQKAGPAVFTYFAEIEFIDGEVEV
ncbi:MAG TPA: hypothetical protein PK228_05440, partial [Saprospiraceae bacterium]|nr:hypothetical protein [Saprospiraceae bacterium]